LGSLALALPRRARLLCVGAHADDLEIGCGGTLLRLLAARRDLDITWVVLSSEGERAREARRSARRLLGRAAQASIRIHGFRDGFFPAAWADLKEVFLSLARERPADIVFTHWEGDRHQDHRVVCELTWNAFRAQPILEYEIPKYDGDLGRPNVYVPLDARTQARKVRHLMSAFPSQERKPWYTATTFNGLMRLRGIESGAREGYAEAYFARKLTLTL
jgi:LmbE family N-acetylglucosaminyl deacetylase